MITLEIKADLAVSAAIFLVFLLIRFVRGNGPDHQSFVNASLHISLVDIGFGSASHSVEEKNVECSRGG
jgi:hypothetical protein